MAEDQPMKAGPARWLWRTILLSVFGAFVGGGVAGNVCYWQGRSLKLDELSPYSPGNAPLHWFMLALGGLWLALWLAFALAQRPNRYPWFAVAVPVVVLAFFTWQQFAAAYACVG